MVTKLVQSEDFALNKNTINAKRYLPEVRVSFHTEKQCYQAKGRKMARGSAVDPTYQLLSASTQKNLSTPAGSFTLTLAGNQWEKRLTPNDLVIISMGYMGETLHTVMVGLIDRVKATRTVSGGKPNVSTTVIGRDFGKLLLKSQLKFYPEIGALSKSKNKFFLTEEGWIDMLSIFTSDEMVQGSPAVILEKIMTHILVKLNETIWKVYDVSTNSSPRVQNATVGSIMRYKFEKTNFFLPFMLTADQFEGALWNLMERATQKPFTELFIDTRVNSEGTVARTVEKSSTNAVQKTTTTKTKTTKTTKSVDKYHVVKKGDTLWDLAARYYKKSTDWRKIWEANKAMMIKRDKRNKNDHGHWIFPGQKLKIPGVKSTVTTTGKTTTTISKELYPKTGQVFGYDKSQVILTYRTAPFESKDWKKLKAHTISDVDVINEDLERTDDEHYNLFWAGVTINPLGDINLKRVVPPLMNEGNVKRYGLCPLEVEIEGLSVDRSKATAQTKSLESLSKNFSATLKAWYENNHKYYNGSLTIRGKADIKIGQRLIYKDIGMEFYVEGVMQTFNVYTDWSTSLTLTRGKKTNTVIDSSKYVPKEPKPKAAAKTVDKYHTVKRGDTLWALAGKYYGKGKNTQWTKIWEANKAMLIKRDKRNKNDHGHWIYPGQKLRVPGVPKK